MTCSAGLCVYNHTLPACIPKSHAKTGIIVGATIGAVAAVALIALAGVAAFFVLGGASAAPTPAVVPQEDVMNANLLMNPTYAAGADGQNPLYNAL